MISISKVLNFTSLCFFFTFPISIIVCHVEKSVNVKRLFLFSRLVCRPLSQTFSSARCFSQCLLHAVSLHRSLIFGFLYFANIGSDYRLSRFSSCLIIRLCLVCSSLGIVRLEGRLCISFWCLYMRLVASLIDLIANPDERGRSLLHTHLFSPLVVKVTKDWFDPVVVTRQEEVVDETKGERYCPIEPSKGLKAGLSCISGRFEAKASE